MECSHSKIWQIIFFISFIIFGIICNRNEEIPAPLVGLVQTGVWFIFSTFWVGEDEKNKQIKELNEKIDKLLEEKKPKKKSSKNEIHYEWADEWADEHS